MGIVTELRETSRLGLLVCLTAATLVATVFGVILCYLAAWVLAGIESWRWMLGLAAVPAAVILTVVCRLPDTPRWYVFKGRLDRAHEILAKVDPGTDVQAEVEEMRRAFAEESGGALGELLRKSYVRATFFVVGLGFFIQITGINAVVYYSPRIFEALGFSGSFALLGLPALVWVVALVSVFCSFALVDRVCRRPILLAGIGTMVLANVLLAAAFLTMLHRLGGSGTFTVFEALAVAAWLLLYRLAPETKGRNLEDIRHYWETGAEWPDEPENHLPVATAAQ